MTADDPEALSVAQRHVIDTLPMTEQDFVGKEHLLYFGWEWKKAQVSSMFTALMNPVPKDEFLLLGPQDLGLLVRHRSSVNFPEVPRSFAMSHYDQDKPQDFSMAGTVVQVDGLLQLASSPEEMHVLRGVGPQSLQVFNSIAHRLGQHLDE